jgi:hypothetical protein
VDEEWSTACVEFLATILDLSRLDKITFNPDFNDKSIHNTMNNINILMGLAYNLSTLSIHPYSSDDDGVLTMENICSIIPHHIKYLEVTVKDLDSVKILLDRHKHLWSLTLLASCDRSLPWLQFIEMLTDSGRDFVYWESYYSLHIWFGKSIN